MLYDLNKLVLKKDILFSNFNNDIYEYIATNDDPQLEIVFDKNLECRVVEISLRVEQGEIIELYLQDDIDSNYTNEYKYIKRIVKEEFYNYVFELSKYRRYIRKIRIDPTNSFGKIEIKYISFLGFKQGMEKKKINVGCGPHDHKEGWINIDIQNFESVDIVMDVTKRWKFKNVDYIFAEHFLEHLKLEQGVQFLYNAYQSLKIGGAIRLSTPNIEWVLKSHYKFENTSHVEMLNNNFNINRAFYGWGHNFLYSEYFLKYIMESIGFESVRCVDYGKSQIDELNGLEQHGTPSIYQGYSSLLIFEGTKLRDQPFLKSDFINNLQENFIKYNNAKG